MDSRVHPFSRYLASFLLASAAFIVFFAFAYGVAYLNYESISSHTSLIASSVEQFEHILVNFSCNPAVHIAASSRFDLIASKISLLEKRFGKTDYRLASLKINYSDLEYRHFLITERFNLECASDFMTIFFFYSNRNDALERRSERIGFILTALQRTHPDEVMIYSFDADLNSTLVRDLKERYEIDVVPVVVVNGGEPFVPRYLAELEAYLDE